MLAQQHRMRTKIQFSKTVRSGVRTGRRNLVLYAVKQSNEFSLCGFIVSKSVGNAVTRNKVKRRLRELCATTMKLHPEGLHLVIRALPASSSASWEELSKDYNSAYLSVIAKLAEQDGKSLLPIDNDGQDSIREETKLL